MIYEIEIKYFPSKPENIFAIKLKCPDVIKIFELFDKLLLD